jgi:phosphate transport system substrate-binding protein
MTIEMPHPTSIFSMGLWWAPRAWMRYVIACAICAIACTYASLTAHAMEPTAPTEISVPSAGAPETLMRKLADAFNAKRGTALVTVPASIGPERAIDAVLSGKTTLASLGRALTAAEKNRGLREWVVAREAVVFATGAGAGVENLSSRQLALIFSGGMRDWARAGGPPAPIRVLYREESELLLQIIRRTMPAFAALRFSGDGKIVIRDHEMIDLMLKFKYAAGWGSLSNIRAAATLRVPALDGIAPSAKTLASGRYPLWYDATLVYRQAPTGVSSDFADFVFSDAGRKIIDALDALPRARE